MSDNTQIIIKQMTDIEFYPEIVDIQKTDMKKLNHIPMADMLALGTAFAPVIGAMQSAMTSLVSGNTMLCSVTFPKGCHLASFHDGSGLLGTALNSNNQIAAQARINPVHGSSAAMKCNPYMIIVATALISVTKKLDTISKTQEDILAFLEQKEQAKVKGNLNFLAEVMNNYKFNWDNEKFCNNHHIKVLDIKQETEKSIELYRSRIGGLFNKSEIFHTSWDVNAKKDKLFSYLGTYQMSVYLYAFSSYLEVLLLGNFEESYLKRIIDKVKQYALDYRDLFTDVSAKLEKFSKDSIASNAMRGIGGFSKFLGQAASSVPLFKEKQIDKGLIDNGKNLEKIETERNQAFSKDISSRSRVDIDVFLDNLKMIDHLYNDRVQILFDNENVYLEQTV
ncbi:MAG: hypothetical protein UH734_07795 [Ruminococcus sp.]|nr:hypothetical protein [Ruminococcus sp.]